MNVNSRVKQYIEDHGIKQVAIAEKMGIPIWQFNNIMTGRKKMSADELYKFCRALNCSADYILRYGDKEVEGGT